MTPPPPRPSAAIARLAKRRGIQDGQLGADLDAALGYLQSLEERDRMRTFEADTVDHARERFGRLAAHLFNQLEHGVGEQLPTDGDHP